ncbi:MAG: type IV pilus secretin PilQ [Deltaproteobacteria bacterium]|nr:type IV pilus secretin PilQ [Deltaproteobacteria bacterium]
MPLIILFASVFMLSGGLAYAQTFAPPADPSRPATPQAAQAQAQGQAAPRAGGALAGLGLGDEKVYTGERISLDFQNADIHNILRLIGEVSGKNVVVSDAVSGKVTLKLRNVPWDQALDIVLASKNLDFEEVGNVLRIDTKDNIRRATPDYSDPTIRVTLDKWTYTPKYSSVTTLAAELEKAKSPRGTVRVIGNDIYVEDDVDTLKAIRLLAVRNDRVTKQILIEARIVEATALFQQSLGVRWGGGYDRFGNFSNHTEAMDLVGTDLTEGDYSPGEAFGAFSVGNGSGIALGMGFLNRAGTLLLNAELSAAETVGQTKIISAPRIMAANDQQVYIKQGQQIPYKSGGGLGTNTSTEFKDAVMELRVTPHIEENGEIVTLDITLTKDSPGERYGASDEPSINKREAYTKLMVKNGETVVIGGIITDDQSVGGTRVPGLHAIPLLGWLFEEKNISNSKTELLIFITASIIPINI